MADTPNFPDIIGYITGGERFDLGAVQVVAAIIPSIVKAGKTFRIAVILQNMVEAPVEMLVMLSLPTVDNAGKRNRFSAKTLRTSVGMQPAEVGMILLPVTSMGDTAAGPTKFPIGIDGVKMLERGGRIRAANGGSPLYVGGLPAKTRQLLDNLARQKFVGGKKGLLTGSASLEPIALIQMGGLTEISELQAEYRTIWTRADLREDPLMLLDRFKDDMSQHALISLDRTQMIPPLVEKTAARFKQAGYELQEVEAKLIGRVLAHILEYACTGQMSYGRTYLMLSEYEVLPMIQRPPYETPEIKLRWLIEVLYAVAEDNRVPKYMARTIVKDHIYDALVRDALTWSLNTVEAATGLELGTTEELEAHANQWYEKYQKLLRGAPDAEPLNIEDVYLPLVLAGIATYDDLTLPDEDIKAFNPLFQVMLRERADERTAENSSLYDIAATLLDKALKKYGLGLL